MSIDMQQFHGVFFDESNEHLVEMERILLEIDPDSPDAEQLNSIFRAAHSIKGGSGIFGFDALTRLTHVMENLLDLARKEQLSLTVSLVDTLLGNVDTLKVILDCYRAGGSIDWDSIEKNIQALEKLLNTQKLSASNPAEEDNKEIESFGMFAQAVEFAEEDAFGFFDDAQEAVDGADKSSTSKLTEQDDGFGLFDEDNSSVIPDLTQSDATKPDTTQSDPIKQSDDKTSHDSGLVKGNDSNKSLTATNSSLVNSSPATKKTPVSTESSTIRVDISKIDSLVNLVGEIVITQSMLSVIGAELAGAPEDRIHVAIAELERNTREIQETVMSMRMLPMSFVFNRFPRVVRDLSSKLGKQIELVIKGGSTEIDKGLIEKLVDPLTHLIRNSIDHGIETPDKRKLAGKSPIGIVKLIAEQKGGNILIRITDDGGGLNRDKILAKAEQNKLEHSASFNDQQVWNLIFLPGFSTAEVVSNVSGRGVGMDVVRRNIECIGGNVEIESETGKGSSFNIRLPLTLAIVDGMCVSVGDQIFVVPLVNIVESIQPSLDQIKAISNDVLLWIRDQYWPLVSLHENMQIENAITDPNKGIVVLIESSKKRFALLVDSLVGQQQVVIKSLEKHYKKVGGIAGATIMGDGRVAMILDVESLASLTKSPNKESAKT
jgi:two-component system chemotaxis sensor kinase CheA